MPAIFIDSYDTAKKAMAKCRSPRAGRPLGVSGMRLLHGAGTSFTIEHRGVPLVDIHSSNTVEFRMATGRLRSVAHYLSAIMNRVLPVTLIRFKSGRYRVGYIHPPMVLPLADINSWQALWEAYWKQYNAIRKEGTEYFPGLIVGLNEGGQRVLNPMSDTKPVIDTDRRKQWLSNLRWFKRQIKARIKMGGLPLPEDRNGWSLDFNTAERAIILRAMDRREINSEVEAIMAEFLRQRVSPESAVFHKLMAVDATMDHNSLALREDYGVITGTHREAVVSP